MITQEEFNVLSMFLEGFLYGKISILYALTLTCTLLKRSNGLLGIYSGVFSIYLQYAFKESRTATTILYALCLLYVLSTATVVIDSLGAIIEVSENSI